jgi:hypothetical protein
MDGTQPLSRGLFRHLRGDRARPHRIDAVFIDNDGVADQSTELDQRVPVSHVASQPRNFDRKHCPGAALADRCQQAFKAWTTDARAGAAEVVVDDDYLLPSELTRAVRQSVLAMAALVVGTKKRASASRI